MGLFSFGGKSAATERERVGTTGRTTRGETAERRGSRARAESRDRRERGDTHGMLDPTIPEKQRARRRLVGAVALALAAVVILPMVLDSHPRPMTDDIAIAIPDQKPAARADAGAAAANAGQDAADAGAAAALADDNPRDTAGPSGAANTSNPTNTAKSSDSSAAAANNTATTANTAVAGLAAPAAGKPATPAPTPHARTANATSASTAAHTSATLANRAATQGSRADAGGNAGTNAVNRSSRSLRVDNAAADPIGAFASNDLGTGNAGTSSSNLNNANSRTNAATSAATAAATNSRFVVQLGSTASAAQAAAWVGRLKALGVPAYSQSSRLADGSERLTLRAGPFSDRASAEAAVRKVRQAGLSSQPGA